MSKVLKNIKLRNGFILKRVKLDYEEGWEEVKDSALVTIHKKSIEGKPVSSEWKKKILLSSHSVIREYNIRFTIEDIYRYVADQIVRHNVGVEHFMGTARPDRHKNIPRNEQTMDMLTILKESMNIQAFLNVCYSRLCVGCVTKETRELIEDLVEVVKQVEPEIAFYCVPSCVKLGGCKEAGFSKCQYYKNFLKDSKFYHTDFNFIDNISNLENRYLMYNDWKEGKYKPDA